MESGLGLGQVDQVLRDSFFFQGAADHVFVAAGAGQGSLYGASSAIGEVADEAGYLVGHHEGQVGAGGLYFGFGFGFDLLVDCGSLLVGFVDGGWFRLLLGEAVALLQRGYFQAVDAVENAVQFLLEAVVRLMSNPLPSNWLKAESKFCLAASR